MYRRQNDVKFGNAPTSENEEADRQRVKKNGEEASWRGGGLLFPGLSGFCLQQRRKGVVRETRIYKPVCARGNDKAVGPVGCAATKQLRPSDLLVVPPLNNLIAVSSLRTSTARLNSAREATTHP